MKAKHTNAKRFIEAYNAIDYAIRVQHNFKRSMGFSDMIRKAVMVNNLVRKYEDDLVSFGRLRNAIIHGTEGEKIIAEPHDDVVEKIELIAKLITTPPLALDSLNEKEVFTVMSEVKILDVIKQMSRTNYSNIPVYKDNNLIGVANGQKILDALGKCLLDGNSLDEFINNTDIEKIVTIETPYKYYEIVDSKITIDKVLGMFLANRKLLAIIITKNGTNKEYPLAIITSSDYMELNNILDNY